MRISEPVFFAHPSEFRKWLEAHHATEKELWVGFHKRKTERPTLTWPQSVDQALCFGWIDGIRKSLGETSYAIRFTPRKATSIWSAVNIRRIKELQEAGEVHAHGLEAFEKRSDKKSQIYAYEQRDQAALDRAAEKQFRSNVKAWKFFAEQAPWYKRTASYWVMTAKRAETRAKRLEILIEDSEAGRRIKQLDRATPKQ